MTVQKIALITQWFPPEPVRQPLWIAQAIRDSGKTVHVVSAAPNYPTGEVYPGYKASKVAQDRVEGIPVTRCPIYPSHDRSTVRRAMNYLSFAASASWFGRREISGADAAVVYSSPATTALPATLAQALKGKPYLLIIQDLWPDTVLSTGFLRPGWKRSLVETTLAAYDRVTCQKATRVLAISPGMRAMLIERGVPSEKIAVMYNWVDEDVFFPRAPTGELRRLVGADVSDIVLLYAGNHGPAQDLDSWLEALARVQDLTRLHTVFMGDGVHKERLVDRAHSLGLQRVYFLDPVPTETYCCLAADADAQIISLGADPLFQVTVPGKLQACLALGSCVVASVSGDAAEIIHRAQAGYLAAPGNVFEIEQRLRELYHADPSALLGKKLRASHFYREELSRAKGSEVLAKAIEDMLGTQAG